MDLRFCAVGLRAIDALRCEALALPMFAGERPLPGALGLVDFRLCGLVSRMMLQGRIDFSAGECVLLPGKPRLSADKVFLFGLGPRQDFSADSVRLCSRSMFATLQAAGVRRTALVLPGRQLGHLPAAAVMRVFLESIPSLSDQDELTVIEQPEAQREMAPVVEGERRRARAVGR